MVQLSPSLAALVALYTTQVAVAATWTEPQDAGDLPGTAQVTLGSGPLDAIEGSILDEEDQDMFLVMIEDPQAFSASTNNPGTNLEIDNDTQLFLFDADGFGALANDDDPDDFFTFLSAIPVGNFSGPAGTYLLAVSIFDNDPIAAGGEIFPDEPADDVVGSTGPGGANAISAWDVDPFPPDSGPYRIELTGVTFAPESRGGALWALAASLIVLWFRGEPKPSSCGNLRGASSSAPADEGAPSDRTRLNQTAGGRRGDSASSL